MAEAQESVWLLAPEVLNEDHLRLPRSALIELGEHSQVLGALIFVCGSSQGRGTYASLAKLAAVALVSVRSAQRSLKVLVKSGWIHRHGRQQAFENSQFKRRTVTYSLNEKALEAALENRYFKLPRSIVGACRNVRRPLLWAERVLLAYLVSRHTLVEMLEESGQDAEHRNIHSHRLLIKHTGLTRNSVRAGLRGLQERQMIVIDHDWDDSYPPRGQCITLNSKFYFRARFLPPTAFEEITGTAGNAQPKPPRIRKPCPERIKAGRSVRVGDDPLITTKPRAKRVSNVSGAVGAAVTKGGVNGVRRQGERCLGVGSNVSIAINQTLESNLLTSPPKKTVLTRRSPQAATTPGDFSNRGEKNGGTKKPPESEAESRVHLYVVKRELGLVKSVPPPWKAARRKCYSAACEAGDWIAAWKALDEIEGIARPFEPPKPAEAVA